LHLQLFLSAVDPTTPINRLRRNFCSGQTGQHNRLAGDM
jgi:hypothetical protein